MKNQRLKQQSDGKIKSIILAAIFYLLMEI